MHVNTYVPGVPEEMKDDYVDISVEDDLMREARPVL